MPEEAPVRVEGNAVAVYRDQDMTAPESMGFLHGGVVAFSSRCPGKTKPNEDAAAVIPFDETSGVIVVADGMGGHAAGDVAAQYAVREVAAAIAEARKARALLRTAIIDGFERAHQVVQELAGAGTTLAAVELNAGTARPYHAGDSIILVTGGRGKVKLETTSHSPVAYAVEAGMLDAHEAMYHEERHVVLNAIGLGTMRIDIGSPIPLARRDTVLLASDGLTDNLAITEIVERVRRGRLVKGVASLVAETRHRMTTVSDKPSKPDDLTIVAFRGA